jgi:hypothetical protein
MDWGSSLSYAEVAEVPKNSKIVVHSGKKALGKRLQNRVRQNTQEIPVEFYNDRS